MALISPSAIAVLDFRRRGMMLEWHASNATWTACDSPPALVHGVALIRASQPNICIYGHDDRLHLQVGAERYPLSDSSVRVRLNRGWASLGLRRCFTLESAGGSVLFSHVYWTAQENDFFRWLAARAMDSDWRAATGPRWSEGMEAALLRSS